MMIDRKGIIKVIFERGQTKLDYKLHIDDLRKKYDTPIVPEPPFATEISQTKIKFNWNYPEPKGVAQLVEIQYALITMDNAEEDDDCFIQTGDFKWAACVSKRWEYTNFDNFEFENLQPGLSFVFRMRYRNCKTWSKYSDPSDVMTTLPAPPSQPTSPIFARKYKIVSSNIH